MIEMTDEELALFREVNEQAQKDGAKNIFMYFDGKLPNELMENINYEIYQSLSRIEAEDAIDSYGIECFSDMSEEEYDEMSREELIERCMEDSDGVLDYSIVEIKIL